MRFESNEKYIRKDIEGSITRSMNAAFLKCCKRTPEEPDFIAELVTRLPRDLYNSLKVYAPTYRFAVSGVFCHQKPLADFGAEKNPELGDILLVYIEENKYEVKKCNALLMQAKKFDKAPYIIPNSENHQLRLYEEWPVFYLMRAGRFNGAKIDVQPKTLNSGAQYLLLQAPYKDEKMVSCAYPDKVLVPEKRLSRQIIDLMKFFTGRTFTIEKYNEDRDGWSQLMLDLIRISRVSRFNRKNSGWKNAARRIALGDESLFGAINEWIGTGDYELSDYGISCVMIYARESQERYYQ